MDQPFFVDGQKTSADVYAKDVNRAENHRKTFAAPLYREKCYFIYLFLVELHFSNNMLVAVISYQSQALLYHITVMR